MEPSKQESISRQSSILKAPKQRQPLQCVATNPSSSESSPTIKIKRRVSFARNKRIREFCNEVEPKEGLDDSYEEHDLSNTKSSSSNSTDHPLVISVPCEDKENFPVQLFLPTNEIECQEIRTAVPSIEGDNLSQCQMEMDNSINTFQSADIGIQNKELTYPNTTIYFDDGMDITTSVQPQIISEHIQDDKYCNDTVIVSQTCMEDVPMEMTENLPSIYSKKLVHVQSTKNNENFEYNLLNFTEPVSTILGIGNVKNPVESLITKQFTENFENETECFNDMPLEFTSVIPSSTWIKPNSTCQNNDKTERFDCKTMEFTEVVHLNNIMCKNKTEEIGDRPEKVMETLLTQLNNQNSNASMKQIENNVICQEKNNIIQDKSMEIINAIPNSNSMHQIGNLNKKLLEQVQEKNTIFPNISMEITEAVPVCNKINKFTAPMKKIEEKTKIFCDTSMEITEAVPVCNEINKFTAPMKKIEEKTKIFCDQSIELTGVPNNSELDEFVKSSKNTIQSTEKTKLYLDTSMEMTEVVPNKNEIYKYVGSKDIGLKLDVDKTKVFVNTSMEMTEAVPTIFKIDQPIENVKKIHPEIIHDKTKLFNDKSMEITEAVNHNKYHQLGHSKTQLVEPGQEKTQLFFNASMEMTEAVPVCSKTNRLIVVRDKVCPEITEDRTKIFYDKSMEVTEAVFDHKRIQLFDNFDSQPLEARQEKTKLFFNTSMELTEGVSKFNKIKQPIADIKKNHRELSLENTKFFYDKSLEITEAVPVHHQLNQFTVHIEKSQQEKIQDSTKIFPNHNKTRPFCNSKNQSSEPGQEQTKIFSNVSMEITEAVPVSSNIHQLGSEFKDVYRNICTNTHQLEKSKIDNKTQEKTTLFQNISVTETIPVHNAIWQCNKENYESEEKSSSDNRIVQSDNLFRNLEFQTNNWNSENMAVENDMKTVEQNVIYKNITLSSSDKLNISTECAPSSNQNLFMNYTQDKTMSVSTGEKTKVFQNKSLDFTEILPVLQHQNISSSCVQNEISNTIPDRTNQCFNNSIDMKDVETKNQNLFSTNPSIFSDSIKDIERLHQSDMVLPNRLNIQDCNNSNHLNNKNDNIFNKSNYKDNSFHRMTTDELNTLCASMNLPTQNYTERNSTLQNDFISVCNDVNVLRDSLQKNTIFQQNFTTKTDDLSKTLKSQNNLQLLYDANTIEKSGILLNEKTLIVPTETESSKEYSTIEKHVLEEANHQISEIKSAEVGIRNLEDYRLFNNSNKTLENPVGSNNSECLNANIFNRNEQNPYDTQSNIHNSDNSETLIIDQNLSINLSKTPKSWKSKDIDQNVAISENSLNRLPSDNTDVLIATMGQKTELSHPLIINDRTTIKIPKKPIRNDTNIVNFYPNESSETEKSNDIEEVNKKSLKKINSSMEENVVFNEEGHSLNEENEGFKQNKCNIKTESFSANTSDKLDEIQPPSFLCSDSFQSESMVDPLDEPLKIVCNDITKQQKCLIFEKQYNQEDREFENSSIEMEDSFEKGLPVDNMNEVYQVSNLNRRDSKCVSESIFSNSLQNINESVISLINEEDINTDPFKPFLSLMKSIEIYEKRDDCIWALRKIDQKTIAVDFIATSFVTIIRLNEIEKACIKDIDNIEFISRLHCDSKNILLKIVHRLLLSKLKSDKLLSEYKMYEDVLPLLECISNEVILAMNFMFDIERLSALNLLSIDSERVTFMVSSKKANIILEISLALKIFNEIGPDDINVICVLGDIRIIDIKQLIVNIKRDPLFLSRYINDVKDYITLMEESTYLQR